MKQLSGACHIQLGPNLTQYLGAASIRWTQGCQSTLVSRTGPTVLCKALERFLAADTDCSLAQVLHISSTRFCELCSAKGRHSRCTDAFLSVLSHSKLVWVNKSCGAGREFYSSVWWMMGCRGSLARAAERRGSSASFLVSTVHSHRWIWSVPLFICLLQMQATEEPSHRHHWN